jgi:hypothetical protein
LAETGVPPDVYKVADQESIFIAKKTMFNKYMPAWLQVGYFTVLFITIVM